MTPTNLAISLLGVSDRLKDAIAPETVARQVAELRRHGLPDDANRVEEMCHAIALMAEEFASLREAVRTKFNIQERPAYERRRKRT